MDTTHFQEPNQTREQLGSTEMTIMQSVSNELVKRDPSENDGASTPTANHHPRTAQNKTPKRRLDSVNKYTVGIITALAHEKTAVIAMLDEQHDYPFDYSPAKHDDNTYSWGMMRGHNVAVASLGAGSYGTTQAAHTVAPMLSSLPEMRFGLLVGIGAGIPRDGCDIRLGDVAISVPGHGNGGVYQYDALKAKSDHELEHIGFLNKPSDILLKGVQDLQSKHLMEDSTVPEHLEVMVQTWPKMARSTPSKPSFLHQGSANDRLFPVDYPHVPGEKDCGKCDSAQAISRPPRDTLDPEFHYGVIASGNTLVKDSIYRDELIRRIPGCICFEMEAAGVMNKLPCLVVRGICDYADSHKNDLWQNYAAAVAAGYAKELLSVIAPIDVERSKPALAAMQDIKKGIAKIESMSTKTQDDLQRFALKKWLEPPDTSAAYKNARDLHQAGTCHWFLTSETFSRWKEGHTPLIWIHGIPGSGKTILSSSIIEELKVKPQDPADVVLYFYFEYKTTSNATFDGMIRNFLAHLFPRNGEAQAALKRLQTVNQMELPPTEDLVKILEFMIGLFNRVQVVIDALDEIKVRDDLLRLLAWIKAAASVLKGRIQLIVTSRHDEDITSHLGDLGETVALTRDVVKDDIKQYVGERIRQDTILQKWNRSTEAREAIKSALIEKSDGMFRWVFCQLDALRTCYNYEDLVETLETLPQTLEGTYTRILERITSRKQRQRAITILQFLLYYDGLLHTEMLLDAIIVNPSQRPSFNPINRFPDPRDLARICGSLVTIDWYGRSQLQDPQDGVLRIAHFSVREYLTNSNQVHQDFKEAFQQSVAYSCFIQISLGYLRHIPTSLDYTTTVEQYPLTIFSMDWPRYAHCVQKDRGVSETIRSFFADDAYHSFVRLYNLWNRIKVNHCAENDDIADHLWILSSLKLDYCLVDALSETNISSLLNNSRPRLDLGRLRPTFQEFDPLLRVCGGYGTISEGVEPRTQKERGLHFAARKGAASVVKALLSRHADAHVEGGDAGTALSAAMRFNKPDVVSILQKHYNTLSHEILSSAVINTLKGVADIYSGPHVLFGSWLHKASKSIMVRENDFNEVLRAALLYGNQTLVDMCLEKGQSIASPSIVGITFVDAIRMGKEDCAERILKLVDSSPQYPPRQGYAGSIAKALVHTLDAQYGRSALHWAAGRGYVGLTKALVSRHADITLTDKFGETPLHRAAEQGCTEIAEILIVQGADTMAIDQCFRVPLRSAFLNDHFGTCWTVSPSHLGSHSFKSLLNEIDPEKPPQLCAQTPRSTKIFFRQRWQQTGIQQRIESDCPEARYFLYSISNLYEFSERVELELESFEEHLLFQLVRQLRDAILSGKHERVRAALQGSHVPMVVNARFFDFQMSTPLLLAASNGLPGIFLILLNKGANPSLMDVKGRSPVPTLNPRQYGPEVHIPIFARVDKLGLGLDDPRYPGQTYLDFVKTQGPSEDGTTCLHYAAREGCTQIVNALLDIGANVEIQNKYGQTPVDYARAADHLDIFGIRLDPLIRPSETRYMSNASEDRLHKKRFTEPPKHESRTIALAMKLHKAIHLMDFRTANRLLDAPDADPSFVNLVDLEGRSALHWAAESESPTLVQSLLDLGATTDLDYEGHRMPVNHHANIKDDEGKTPLHCAAEAGKLENVKILVGGAAHVWALDNQGRTPQELADIGVSQAHREVANWLDSQASSEWEKEEEDEEDVEEEEEDEDVEEKEDEDSRRRKRKRKIDSIS